MTLLRVEALRKAFGGLVATNGVDMAVAPGSIHGLIGPNGAGKTTLFSLITGFYKPDAGRIVFDGREVTREPTSTRARHGLVRTFQGSVLFREQSVRENVENGNLMARRMGVGAWAGELFRSRGSDDATVDRLLTFVGLGHLADAPAGGLSHGHQRVLGIAVALAASPKLLLLDEPFTGMTAGEKDRLIEMIRELRIRGMTVVLVEHDMRAVMRLCDRITVLNFGKVLTEGAPEHVRSHPEVIAAYLGEA